jgi:hypothetical protein
MSEVERLKAEAESVQAEIEVLKARLLQLGWQLQQALTNNASPNAEVRHVAGIRIS